MKQIVRTLCFCLAVLLTLSAAACGSSETVQEVVTTKAAVTKPSVDEDVPAVLRTFYQDQLPSMALKSGIQDPNGEEIRCDYSMLKKAVFTDFDSDGVKEIVLQYDVSEKAGKKALDVVVFLDEKDGSPVVAATHFGAYGASSDGETNILTRYNSRICKVRFIKKSSYEVVLIDYFTNGKWSTAITAYKHISDHGKVKLENGSCYVDHAGKDLYKAVTGELYYSKEKYLNYRTPNENYDSMVTSLLADTLLP